MRFSRSVFDQVKTGNFLGQQAPNGRVTVDPFWSLKKTAPVYGNSFKGPYRYYTNYDSAVPDARAQEYEIPSIKSISWNRSNSQDLGSCTITLYNSWHNLNSEEEELVGQIGKPGYFWPKRGQGDSSATWNQTPGKGAYKKDGTWDPNFSWSNVLVEDALLRTYEGFGGKPTSGNYKSIDQNLEDENVFITGVWIINSVTAGADGMMTLSCTDIGRILLDQIVFPPVVPPAVYPLEYYPPGKSAFDSPWGPRLAELRSMEHVNGQSVTMQPGEIGEVWIRDVNSSADSDSTVNTLYPSSAVSDGDWDTYSLSEAYGDQYGGLPYWEVFPGKSATVGQAVNGINIKTWGGGYTVYISIAENPDPDTPSTSYVWRGDSDIPGGGIKYVKKVEIPLYLPDGMENPMEIDFPDYVGTSAYDRAYSNTYYPNRIRLTFEKLSYSHVPDGTDRYRAGIRDLTLLRQGNNTGTYTPQNSTTPWTFAIEQHPTRGYWVIDTVGRVHGFGDASDYDFNRFGDVPIQDYGIHNRAVGIAAHPSGEGYWVVDWMGRVWAYGAAAEGATAIPATSPARYNFGEYKIPDPYVDFDQDAKTQVRGIAATHTGNGYWVVYSNGVVRGFGDATPSYVVVPSTDVATFMDAFLNANYTRGKFIPYNTGLKATAIAAHPKKMGFWVTDGSGQVWAYGAATHKGQLKNRVYLNSKMAGTFKLQNLEWATSLEATEDGEGYWIAFGSGRVASFGNAQKLGKNPYVFEQLGLTYPENVIQDESEFFDDSFFRRILWGLARDPSGKGFWVLKANGEVVPYDADFWGQPGYGRLTGLKWHDGNFNGDWANIVKEMLMWGGFLFYDTETPIGDDEAPSVLGAIESTGIVTDTIVAPDKFDKKTLMDVIKELTEVVGYRFRIDEEGRAIYTSPNWWTAGNFDRDGIRIYVNNAGERVDSDDPEAEPFIPIVHEEEDLLSYTVTLSSTDKRSEIIIGTDLPDPKDPTRTGYIVHNPPHTLETVSGGVNTMRGIERTAIWISQLFENEEERKLMAELIGLHAWFASRTGSAGIIGNPCLSIDDQVRIVERNTSETFIHLITGIDSSMDLDEGTYTMELTTNWLGKADDWVIATEPKDSEYIYTVISDNLNSWQSKTNRGLNGGGSQDSAIISANGEFDALVSEVTSISEMIVLGDSLSYLDSTLDGMTGDRWPNLLEDAGTVITVKNGAMSGYTSQDLVDDPIVDPESTDALVIFIGANDQNTSLSGVSVNDYADNITYLLDNYPATQQLVVFPWPWTGYPVGEPDPAPTVEEYNAYAAAAAQAAAAKGAKFLHMGTVVDQFMDQTNQDNFDDYIVDEIHASALGHELLAEQISSRLHIQYGDSPNWSFTGTIETIGVVNNFKINVNSLTNLGSNIYLEILDGSDVVFAHDLLYQGQTISVGSLGVSDSKTYTYTVTGTPTNRGMGILKLTFNGGTSATSTVTDSIVFVDLPEPEEPTTVPDPLDPDYEIVPSDTLFGWCASSTQLIEDRVANGYVMPDIWRHFMGDVPSIYSMDVGGGPWSPDLPLHISFKPDISGSVSIWSSRLESYLRKGKVAGQVTYVTLWHEPENDLDEAWMASTTNYKRALNEVTRICRKLTAEGTGKFYSTPVMMDYTLNPISGRDIDDWLDGTDYDVIGFDIYPLAGSVIAAIEPPPFLSMNIVDSIDRCEAYAISKNKPWSVPEISAKRYNAEMAAAGVPSYDAQYRADFIVDVMNYFSGLSKPPVYVTYYAFGANVTDENPELAALNSVITG